MAKTFTKDNFEVEVIQSDKPVLVDFWAEWCGPCKMIAPLIDQVGEALGEAAVVGKVDVDTEQDLAREYGIQSIPTLLFFKNGEIKDKIVGAAVNLELLKDKLTALS